MKSKENKLPNYYLKSTLFKHKSEHTTDKGQLTGIQINQIDYMHSHLEVWDNYRKFANKRGWLVATILKQFTSLKGKQVLDFGCGEGGTSRTLFQLGAKVTAVDTRPELEQIFKNTGIVFIKTKNEESYFRCQNFDIVILQDVLEHVPDPEEIMKQIKYCLRPGGLVFISTPNRFSLLNVMSDPHWNLPGVALFPRKIVVFFVRDLFRRDQRQRTDWAALLSLKKLQKIMESNDFDTIFVNSFVAKILFQQPQSVVCHPGHIQIIQWLRRHHLDRWIFRLVNDRKGIFNFLINPTWYLMGQAR